MGRERRKPVTMLNVPTNTRLITLRGETKFAILMQKIICEVSINHLYTVLYVSYIRV